MARIIGGVACSHTPTIGFAHDKAGADDPVWGPIVAAAGFFMSGAQTGLNAFAPNCYPTMARATGVSWMLGMGRFGSILGSSIGGVFLAAGLGFQTIIALLAVPAILAGLAVLKARTAQEPAGTTGEPRLARI